MLIFSTIAAIISPIVYLFPFLYLWMKGEEKYVLYSTNKVIKNKNVFLGKIMILLIMFVAFIYAWPTKVMFYPLKVGVFIGILVGIQVITNNYFLENNNVSKIDKNTRIVALTCWITLFLLAAISIYIAGIT